MMTEDATIEFSERTEDIAFRVSLLSDKELKANLREYRNVMRAFCKKVMPELFGKGKYKMEVTDNGYDGTIISFTCDTPHPDKFANTEQIVSIDMHCPESMTDMQQRELFSLASMFKSMFTKEDTRNDHQMPFNSHWTLDTTQAETVHKQPKLAGFSGCSVMTESVICQVLHCPDFKTLDDVKKHFGIVKKTASSKKTASEKKTKKKVSTKKTKAVKKSTKRASKKASSKKAEKSSK